MATTEAITIYISDLNIIDDLAKKRVGKDIDLKISENRKLLIQLRKDILHDIIQNIPHGEEI